MFRQIEVVVDKWPIGPQNRMHSKGDRIFIDATAAHILVGLGKCAYVADDDSASRPTRRGRYTRRDMKAQD